jgi:hypothetical protein
VGNRSSILLLNNLIPHRSLTNVSRDIRWSLDLRWQEPHLPAGFWGIKDSILMRKGADPAYSPDWSSWADMDRNSAQAQALRKGRRCQPMQALCTRRPWRSLAGCLPSGPDGTESDADLEPHICGPWMRRWDIVHHNGHTAFMEAQKHMGAMAYHTKA